MPETVKLKKYNMETVVNVNKNEVNIISGVKERISDILMSISWREIARGYFGKSSSWLYHKLDGIDSQGGFTPEEAQQLRDALNDLSNRLKVAADRI